MVSLDTEVRVLTLRMKTLPSCARSCTLNQDCPALLKGDITPVLT